MQTAIPFKYRTAYTVKTAYHINFSKLKSQLRSPKYGLKDHKKTKI